MVKPSWLGPWEAAPDNDHCQEASTRLCVDLCEYMEDCARYTNLDRDKKQIDEATKAWAIERWGSQSWLATGKQP